MVKFRHEAESKFVNNVRRKHDGVAFVVFDGNDTRAAKIAAVAAMVPTDFETSHDILPQVVLNGPGQVKNFEAGGIKEGIAATGSEVEKVGAVLEILAPKMHAEFFRGLG